MNNPAEHRCDKEMVIINMQKAIDTLREDNVKTFEELGNWRFFKKLFFGFIITGILALVSMAISVPSFIYDIKMKAEVMSLSLEDLKRHNGKLSEEITVVKKLQEKEIKNNKSDADLIEIKEVIREAVKEVNSKRKRK